MDISKQTFFFFSWLVSALLVESPGWVSSPPRPADLMSDAIKQAFIPHNLRRVRLRSEPGLGISTVGHSVVILRSFFVIFRPNLIFFIKKENKFPPRTFWVIYPFIAFALAQMPSQNRTFIRHRRYSLFSVTSKPLFCFFNVLCL